MTTPGRNEPCPCGSGKKYKHCHLLSAPAAARPLPVAQLVTTAIRAHEAGQLDQAEALYHQVLQAAPKHFDALHLLGVIAYQRGHMAQAGDFIRRALAIQPAAGPAYLHLGNVYQAQGQLEQAIGCFQKAIALQPDHAMAHFNLGNAYFAGAQPQQAYACYLKALRIAPHMTEALAQCVLAMQQLCAWSHLPDFAGRLLAALQSGQQPPAFSPFNLVMLPVTPALQRDYARRFAQAIEQRVQPLPPALRVTDTQGRIRIGYVSSDFHDHATTYLMAELFELHDRSRFWIGAYAIDADQGSAIRQRIAVTCDQFLDISALTPQQAAAQIAADGIDILVDLKGYTTDARPDIFAFRPAPLQVNWLGYPGTTGAGYMDYLISDSFVTPTEHAGFYTEQLVRLPDCYQVNDRKRAIAHPLSRAEYGLPATGFVFCSFNQSCKFTPEMFDLWMRLLKQVPNSVLWLLQAGQDMQQNLQQEARLRGVEPGRLVFAPKRPLPEHLARYQVADLFLDTAPCGAHTTASDALWAGLPVLTYAGATFAARVAGSLLHGVGLAELVTDSLAHYEALALHLAQQRDQLQALRARLLEQRHRAPLFDTPRFTRHLEAAYAHMWARHQQGMAPQAFDVLPSPPGPWASQAGG